MTVVLVAPYSIKAVTGTVSYTSTPSTYTTIELIYFTFSMSSANATGTVSFYRAGSTLIQGTRTLGSNQIATTSGQTLPQGTHSITATYSGNSVYSPVTSSNSFSITIYTYTALTLASNVTYIVTGGSFTLTTTISPAVSGKTITFYQGVTSLGTGTTNVSGIATYSVTAPSPGSYNYSTNFAGDSTYATSTSNTVTVASEVSVASGSAVFTTSGVTTWTVPANVYRISVMAIGAGGYSSSGGGGGGGGLGYYNDYPVNPSDVITIQVGVSAGSSQSYASKSGIFVSGSGGGNSNGGGGTYTGQGGSVGGRGGSGHVDVAGGGSLYTVSGAGGGAAAGYGGGTQYTGAGGNVSLNGGASWNSPYQQAGGGGSQGDGGDGSQWFVNDPYGYNGGSGNPGAGIAIPGIGGSYGWGAGALGTVSMGHGKPYATYPPTANGGGGAVAILYGNYPSSHSWPSG